MDHRVFYALPSGGKSKDAVVHCLKLVILIAASNQSALFQQ